MTIQDYGRRFREYFPDLGAPNTYLDEMLSLVVRAPRIDILALNDRIERLHGAIPDGVSLADTVRQHYGAQAEMFVHELLGP